MTYLGWQKGRGGEACHGHYLAKAPTWQPGSTTRSVSIFPGIWRRTNWEHPVFWNVRNLGYFSVSLLYITGISQSLTQMEPSLKSKLESGTTLKNVSYICPVYLLIHGDVSSLLTRLGDSPERLPPRKETWFTWRSSLISRMTTPTRQFHPF